MQRDIHKRCKHLPHCYQFLNSETTCKHYAIADPAKILPFNLSSDDDGDSNSSSPNLDLDPAKPAKILPLDFSSNDDRDPNSGSPNLDSDPAMVISDNEDPQGDDNIEIIPGHIDSEDSQLEDISICSNASISGSNITNHLSFNEHWEASKPIQGLDDIIEYLQNLYGPILEKKHHDAHKLPDVLTVIFWFELSGDLIITDEDHDNIRAYHLKIMCNMPQWVFNRMRYKFQHKMDIDSE